MKNTSILLRLLLVILFLLVLNFTSLFSQQNNIIFKHLTVKDGLSQGTVECIIEDSKGFIWFGTQDGLNRYDGYGFVHYKFSFDDSTSIPDNYIQCLAEDNNGNVWVGTSLNGAAKYDYATNNFQRYFADKNNSTSLPDSKISTIYNDYYGNIWLGTYNGLVRYNPGKDNFISCEIKSGTSTVRVISDIVEMNDSILVVATGLGIFQYDRAQKKFNRFEYYNQEKLQALSFDAKTIVATKDEIWFGTNKEGLFRYNLKSKQLTNYQSTEDINSIGSNEVRRVYIDSRKNLWVATVNGCLSLYNPDYENFKRFTNDKYNEFSLSSNSVNSIYEDSFNNLWVGTYFGGVNYFNYNVLSFQLYKNIANNKASLSNNVVGEFCEDKYGRIWAGTNNGLNLFNEKNKTFSFYTPNPNRRTVCNHLKAHKNGYIYIAAWGEGLTEFDVDNKTFKNISTINEDNNKLQDLNLKGLGIDKEGYIWLAAHGQDAVHIFDPVKSQYYNSNNPGKFDKNIFTVDFTVDIFQDSKQRIWLVTYLGLFMYDGKFHKFLNNPKDNKSISSNHVMIVFEDKKHNIWVGNLNGLDKIVEKDSHFEIERYSDKYDIPNNIKGILEDDIGNLWISSNEGIIAFNPETGKKRTFDIENGLQGNDFKEKAAFKSSSGIMFFGGYNGFNAFHPDSVKINQRLPEVFITKFQIFNKTQSPLDPNSPLEKSIIETEQLILDYKHSVISFEYVALNYIGTAKNNYAYKMEGFDEDWHYVGTERKATYTNLDPGTYKFRVIASNNDDVWNQEGKTLNIEILPPWWKTWWFYTIEVGVVLFIVLSFMRIRTQQLRKAHSTLELKVQDATATIKNRNAKLREAQAKLTTIMDDVRNELGRASEELLNATNSQASSIEEISASIDQMTLDINENAQGASKMLDNAKSVEKKTETSVETVAKTVVSIQDITEQIAFISEFARLTNLLSLNASIEAARAGVHGKSFAVIANQIKKLADSSQEVAKDIQVLSESGLKLSHTASEQITDLQVYTQSVVSHISKINESSQNQSHEATNINSAIQQISLYVNTTSELADKLNSAINSLKIDE